MTCARCGRAVDVAPVSRRDTCPGCGSDLRACVQCAFYAPGQYNDCREPQAERVLDKERANFCDLFRPRGAGPAPGGDDSRARARAQLDALFKRKP